MNLREAAYSGGRWTAFSVAVRTALQVAQVAILARLLVPSDFGVVALAGGALAVALLLMDLGLSSALIHFPRPARPVLSSLYWFNLLAAFLLAAVFAGLAVPLAYIYDQPQLVPVVLAMSLVFPLSASGLQFRTIAEKDLRFATLARIEAWAALLGFGVAVGVALGGGGIYALVAAPLATAACSSALSWARLSHGMRPALSFHAKGTLKFIRFGLYRMAENLANGLRMQADIFIGGLFAGSATLGTYSVTRDLSLRVSNSVVNPVITRIGLPLMAALQHDPHALKAVYLQTMRMTASLNAPAYALLAIYADEIALLLLGPQWPDAGLYMRILAMWGLVRSTGNPVGSLLYAVGMVRRAFWWNVALLAALPPLLWVAASRGGMEHLAWVMLLLQVAIFLPAWYLLVWPACGASLKEYSHQLAAPIGTAFVATIPAVLATAGLSDPMLRLLVGTAVLGVSYFGLSWWTNRSWVRVILDATRFGHARKWLWRA